MVDMRAAAAAAMATVEIDVGTGTGERIDIAPEDDPVSVARRYCESQGFPQQIVMPLAVKLEEARAKAANINAARSLANDAKAATATTTTTIGARARHRRPATASAATGVSKAKNVTAADKHKPNNLAAQQQRQQQRPRPHSAGPGRTTTQAAPSSASSAARVAAASTSASAAARPPPSKKGVWGGGPGVRSRQPSTANKQKKKKDVVGGGGGGGYESSEDGKNTGEIFDRLYAIAMRKKEEEKELERRKAEEEEAELAAAKAKKAQLMSRASAEMMRGRTAGEYSSYNERLYAEASHRREAKKEAERRAAEERERREMEELKVRPTISEYAARLVRTEKPWERLSEAGARSTKMAQLAQVKEDLERKALAECTFRPKINEKSKDLMRGRVAAMRDRGVNHHEQLFYDAGRRRMRMEEYEVWRPPDHTFHPNAHRSHGRGSGGDMSLSSSMDGSASLHGWNVDGGGGGGSLPPHVGGMMDNGWTPPVVNHNAVVQRLVASQQRSQQHKERLAEEMYGKLGQPNVGRAPSFPRNPAQLPIHELLYANRHEFDDKKELIQMRDREQLAEEAAASHMTGKSEGLVGALKRRKFRKIFKLLDAEETGMVNLKDVDLNRLRSAGGGGGGGSPAQSSITNGINGNGNGNDPNSLSNMSFSFSGAGEGGGGAGGSSPAPTDTQLKQMMDDVRAAAAYCTGAVGVEGFIAAMEAVLAASKTGPRSYLRPRGGSRATKAEAAAASAAAVERAGVEMQKSNAARTKRLANAKREKLGITAAAPYYEKLIAEGAATKQRLEDLAKSLEEREMSECTFYPETLKIKAPKNRKPLMTEQTSKAGADGADGGDYGGGGGMTPGEKRYHDLERELEAVLALDVDGNAAPMNAESLAAMLNAGGGGGGGSGATMPDLSSDDEDEE